MPRHLRHLALLVATVAVAACGSGEEDAAAMSDAVTTTADQAAPTVARSANTEADSDLPLVRVWKTPQCGCCGDWVEHIRAAGFPVEVHDVSNLREKKQEHGIEPEHQSCHTATVDGYVVEGHVPADLMKRMLTERPDIDGIAVPGMPAGAPGMEVPGRKDAYDVLALVGDGTVVVYDSR